MYREILNILRRAEPGSQILREAVLAAGNMFIASRQMRSQFLAVLTAVLARDASLENEVAESRRLLELAQNH